MHTLLRVCWVTVLYDLFLLPMTHPWIFETMRALRALGMRHKLHNSLYDLHDWLYDLHDWLHYNTNMHTSLQVFDVTHSYSMTHPWNFQTMRHELAKLNLQLAWLTSWQIEHACLTICVWYDTFVLPIIHPWNFETMSMSWVLGILLELAWLTLQLAWLTSWPHEYAYPIWSAWHGPFLLLMTHPWNCDTILFFDNLSFYTNKTKWDTRSRRERLCFWNRSCKIFYTLEERSKLIKSHAPPRAGFLFDI